jgi:hypothetical protein
MLVVAWVWGSAFAPRAPASERLGFGVVALVGLACATMLQGPAGVGLLGRPWTLRAIALILTVALATWRRPSLRPAISWTPVAIAAAATTCVVYPAILAATPRLWPSHQDMLWHQGWIRQLAAGLPAPGGVYAGEPNSYPWLYHSIAAWLLGALPGDLNAALLALDLAGVAAGFLGVWLLARELGSPERAANWAAGLFTAAAGFGWIWQHTPRAVLQANGVGFGPYHGDLVVSNVLNPALGNVPPLLPRDLALCLAPLALWLFVRGVGRGPKRLLWAAGAAIGFVFLIGPVGGGFCTAWAIVLAARARDRAAWRAAVSAAAVAGVWLVPLGLAYRRHGGFVSITHLPPVDPTLAQTVVALGILLPLGAAGTAAILLRPRGVSRAFVALLVGLPVMAVATGALMGQGRELLGTPALLRWSRYLPYLGLGLAVPAGVAADRLTALAARAARPAAVAVVVGLVAVAVPSTILATAAVVEHAFPRQLACSSVPPSSALIAVAIHEPIADEVSLDLFARTAAPSVFLRITRAKVRFRTWLRHSPAPGTQREAWFRALLRDGALPPGVSWVVANPAAPLERTGLVPAGRCSLAGHSYRVFRRK